jgi:DNA polymerase
MTKRGGEEDGTGSLFRMLEDKLDLERRFGVDVVPARKGNRKPDSSPKREAAPAELPSANGSKAEQLAALEREMAECHECPLGGTRTNLVFGVGNPEADLMFIGEAPGADEDAQGIPFVGRAGQLLTRVINAMGLQRSDVYIANILKCRPPENRSPRPSEVACCLPYLRRQIRIIQPKLIVCLGGVAAKTLLQTDLPVGRLRGAFHDYDGTPLLVTFHTAYLLRNPGDKAALWEDMKMVLHRLGLPIPQR